MAHWSGLVKPRPDDPLNPATPEIGQRRVLEMIASGAPLHDTLDLLLRVVEAQSPEMITSILLLEPNGERLRHGAAPRLPETYVRGIDGVQIGESVGSCGTAAWRREPVFVADIAHDSRWVHYSDLALAHGLRACWSTPIFGPVGKVLGTFAIYYGEPAQPDERHVQLIQIATHTAAICINHHRVEQALSLSEARARAVADHSPVGIFMCDPDGKNVYTNRAINAQLGRPMAEELGDRWPEHLHPDDQARVLRAWRKYLVDPAGGYDVELRAVRSDGSERILHVSASPVHECGRLLGHVGNSVDITERKQTERVLHERESRLRAIIETDPECVKLLSPDGELLEMNPAGLAMLEAGSLAEARAKPLLEFVLPEYRPPYQALMAQALRGESGALEFEIVGLRGTRRWLETHVAPMRDQAGAIATVLAITRDISARKRSEATMRESEERFRQVVENINEVFWLSEVDGRRVLYVSPRFEEVWGQSCAALYASPLRWLESVHPEDRGRVEAALARWRGEPHDESYRIVRPDGGERWVRARVFPVNDASGRAYRMVGLAEDITERKRLEAEVMRAHRVESIGRLANGIAHDMNNILAPIVMAAPLLKMGLPPDETEKILDAIENNAKRGADLVRQLLFFSRGVEGGRGTVDPGKLIQEITDIARQTFPRSIEIDTTVGYGTWFVRGDSTQLHQVLLNLCLNARDAMLQGGTLRLSAENIRLDADTLAGHRDAAPGPFVLFRVSDTGVGVPPEIADKIFEPFFTTKGLGKGTGLGLATVLGIVTSHRGLIKLRSERGRGSVFEVYLPAAPERTAEEKTPENAAPPGGKGELILVVDDEPNIRSILAQLLRHSNYRVLVASDGAEAAALFARQPAEIRLVITDLDMPIIDGVGLTRVLRSIRPEVKILVTSGVSGETNRPGRAAELQELRITGFLLKPYTAEHVLIAVHEAIEKQG
jgi:PAS domain S-box-containing protein